MPTIYVAPGTGTGNGTGPADGQARRDLNGIRWEPGTTVLIRRGTRLYLPPKGGRAGLFIPRVNGIRISHYGDAEQPPVLHGTLNSPDGWTARGGGVFSKIGPGQSGVVLYRNNSLPHFDHKVAGALDSLRQSDGGYLISDGSSSPTVYVKLPGGANPNAGGVAIAHTMIGIEHTNDAPLSDLEIDGLEIMGFSRQGMNLRNVTNSRIRNNVVHATGGDLSPAWYVGGCIQCTGGCNNIEFVNNHVYDCYDSPFSPQIPAGNQGASIQNITYRDNLIGPGWALAGVEIATWTSNTVIRNILIENNRIQGGGEGFSGMGDGPRGPYGVIVNSNRGPSPTNRFENIQIRGNHISDIPSGGVYIEHANIRDSIIECNTFERCGTGGSRRPAGNGTVAVKGAVDIETGETLDQDISVASNEISDCGAWGVRFRSQNARSAGQIVNNTLVGNGTWNIDLLSNRTLPQVRNNIMVGSGIRKQGNASLTESHNNVSQGSNQGFSVSAQSTQQAPGLENPSAGDLQLKTGSPLIGAGRNVHEVDRLGRAYQTQDLGCYAHRDDESCTDLEALTRTG